MSEWINEKRKPRSGVPVLTYRPKAFYPIARGIWWNNADGGPRWSVESDGDIYDVTHWMPMPKAPK